jgi:hypothetical protein
MTAQPIQTVLPDVVAAAERFVARQRARDAAARRAVLAETALAARPAEQPAADPRWETTPLEIRDLQWVATPREEVRRLRQAYGSWTGVAEAADLPHQTVLRLGRGQITCAPRVRAALLAAAAALPSPADALIEDVQWLVATGVTLPAAQVRLRMTAEAIEKALRRAGRADVWHALTGGHARQVTG